MNRAEFKTTISQFLKRSLENWFPDKPVLKGLGLSLIDANINKYDHLIEMFENENGEIDMKGIVENMGSLNEPIKIDLRQLSPLLPNRTLLITKEDLQGLYVKQGQEGQVSQNSGNPLY